MNKNTLLILSFFLFFFFCKIAKGQSDSTYSIIVAGHAYGAHDGENTGLHPAFLKALESNVDSMTTKIFLTGDIVNHSTVESWSQVAKELDSLGLDSYYVMGNHDNNSLGYQVFEEKYGGAFYSFTEGKELFIVLNSTESDRSISPMQLDFLEDILSNAVVFSNRVFIFFHEVIWNSNEKYKLVRSNSRSRYDQMIGHSNFWEEIFPLFISYPDKEFYLFAGDVGGNPDAVAASYDKWDNVTLLSSGMGEVKDENYLKVDILPDTIEFELIPLHDGVEMHAIQWYNVPESPLQIEGLAKISTPQYNIKYQVAPVFNATSYQWNLDEGITGTSDSSRIYLNFVENFDFGEISVSAVNDGLGVSEPISLEIQKEKVTSIGESENNRKIIIMQNEHSIYFYSPSENQQTMKLRIFNVMGRLLLSEELVLNPGFNTKNINKYSLPKEMIIIELSGDTFMHKQKLFLY